MAWTGGYLPRCGGRQRATSFPRDQQPHSATVLNGRSQQPHPLDKLWLGLRFFTDDLPGIIDYDFGHRSTLIRVLIEPPRQDWERQRPFRRDETAPHQEAGLSQSDLRRLAGADLLDDRLHGESGSARIQAVAEERPACSKTI